MDYDMFSKTSGVKALTGVTLSSPGTTTGENIDTIGHGSIVLTLTGTITTGQIDSILWEGSDDGVTWTSESDDNSLYSKEDLPYSTAGTFALTAGTVSKQRYVRPLITVSGTVDIVLDDCSAVLQYPTSSPKTVSQSVFATDEINAHGQTGDAVVTSPKRT